MCPTNALSKDFRIIDQVGQSGNKDKLAFSGLCRQIDEGLSKGYTEREVISGVLNAISPASGLSGYLNTVKDLSLVQLKIYCIPGLVKNPSQSFIKTSVYCTS